jgi:hypothetical protein
LANGGVHVRRADILVHNANAYEGYRQGVLAALLAGAPSSSNSTAWTSYRAFWDGPSYTPLRRIHEANDTSRIFAVEGLPEPLA